MAELENLAKQTDETIKELVNTKSQAYKQSKPDLVAMTEKEIYELISSNPRILIRPLLTNGKKLLKGLKKNNIGICKVKLQCHPEIPLISSAESDQNASEAQL